MAFMGETSDVGVAELLSVLARRGHTGRLHINSQGEEVQVILNGGKVTQVSSSHHSLRIGRVLVRMGALKEEELNEAVKQQVSQQGNRPLGQILTGAGMSRRRISPARPRSRRPMRSPACSARFPVPSTSQGWRPGRHGPD